MSNRSYFVDKDRLWSILRNRNLTVYDDFIYAVKTTGIYCRPGCPSRLPNPHNVQFFKNHEAAKRAGYRPCKRCKP